MGMMKNERTYPGDRMLCGGGSLWVTAGSNRFCFRLDYER